MPAQITQKEAIKRAKEILSKGVTREAASAYIGFSSKGTFYKWLNEKPEFKKAVIAAEGEARISIEEALHKGAISGDRLSQMFWLQNRYPDDWVNVSKVEIDHKVGVQVLVVEAEFDVTGRSELKPRPRPKELKPVV